MRDTHKKITAILGTICLLGGLLPWPLAGQTGRGADIAIVVNPDTPVGELSLSEVRKVMLGERQYWSSRIPIVLLIRAPVARERDVVLKVIYQMTETEYNQFWVAKIFRAEAAIAPKIVYSNDMQFELITAIPGAIAFVDARNVRPGMRVVKVDGHLPGDRNYPLK
jgi:ABC-type phosphate transport system substrate-binding protein